MKQAIIILTFMALLTMTVAAAEGENFGAVKIAISNGNFEEFKTLVTKDPGLLTMRDSDGSSLLHLAAYAAGRAKYEKPEVREQYKNIVLFLISKNASLTAKKDNGNTPLHLAVFGGSRDVVEILLAKKADVTARNNKGDMPIHTASRVHDTGIVAMLLDAGADVNARNINEETPLMLATMVTDPEMMEFFITKGADVNAQNSQGNTSLHTAVFNSDTDAIAVLMKHGADPTLKNKMGLSAETMTTDDDIKALLKRPIK